MKRVTLILTAFAYLAAQSAFAAPFDPEVGPKNCPENETWPCNIKKLPDERVIVTAPREYQGTTPRSTPAINPGPSEPAGSNGNQSKQTAVSEKDKDDAVNDFFRDYVLGKGLDKLVGVLTATLGGMEAAVLLVLSFMKGDSHSG